MNGFGRGLAGALTFAVALSSGCEKKSATPAASPAMSGLPPLAEEAKPTAAADHPSHEMVGANPHAGTGALPPGHPAVGGAEAAGAETTPGDIPFDPKTVIAGVIKLDDKVKAKVATGDVIYVVARAAGQAGPPLAVKRLTAAAFPMAFQLDGRDAMMAGTQLAGKITLSVRVDKDGDAMTKNPGDVTGSKTIDLPANKVVVTLDTVL